MGRDCPDDERLWRAKVTAIYLCYRYSQDFDIKIDGKVVAEVRYRFNALPEIITLRFEDTTFVL